METLILIGTFVSGLYFSQVMDAQICRHIDDVVNNSRAVVTVETELGTLETIKTARCVGEDMTS